MINPYFCYVVGFIFSVAIYQLNWSEAYPSLRFSLLSFLLRTILIHTLLGYVWAKKTNVVAPTSGNPPVKPGWVTSFIFLLWIVDFVHEGGIPLVKIILNIPFDYKLFGMPMLHVLVVTFSSFYSLHLLNHFLMTKRKILLWLYLINLAPAILIYSRSMILFNLSTSFFLYLLHLKKIPYRRALYVIPVFVVIFYLFGIVGTIRVSFEAKTAYDKNSFLNTGKATSAFRNSPIPKEFFWPYIYISSPLANLQTNINTYPIKPITIARVLEYINNEWLVESLSKRINTLSGIERESENTIAYQLNVSTVYSRGYSYLGWYGVVATGILLLILPIFYMKLIVQNPNRLIGIALLCTTYLFLCYDNTIRLMALGFQLFYPIAFPFVESKLSKISLHA